LSHVAAIRCASKRGLPFALICEDDACFAAAPLWPESLRELVERSPGGWDWLLISHIETGWFAEEYVDFDFHTSFKWGAAAYVVSRQGMNKVDARFAEGAALSLPTPCDPETRRELGAYFCSQLYSSGELLLLVLMPMFLRLGTPLVFQNPITTSTRDSAHDWLHVAIADRVSRFWVKQAPKS
jgi:GR25 family glycosyltransferase involved in LPS biosynthesis